MIAPDWLLYLGAAILVLIALRLAGASSRRGQIGTLRANLEKKKEDTEQPPGPQRTSKPRPR